MLDLETKDEFIEVIKNELVLIYFWAPWCPPCVRFAPKFAEFAKTIAQTNMTNQSDTVLDNMETKTNTISLHKINIDNPNLNSIAIDYGIQSIPTIIAFSYGLEIERNIGVPDDLKSLVHYYKSLIQ